MLGTVIKRLLQGIFVIFCVVFISFVILRMIPGDPAKVMAPNATEEQLQIIRDNMGLSEPILVQFKMYAQNLLHGEMGRSYFKNDTVVNIIAQTVPLSVILLVMSVLISVFLALILGTISGIHGGTWIDRVISSIAVFLQSMPNYWVSSMLIILFSVKAGIFPSMDYSGPISCVLPIVALSLPLTAVLTKVIRSSLMDSYTQEFVKVAYARGVSKIAIYFKYALRNSLNPVLISLGSQLGFLVGSIVVVEYVFSFPGIGYTVLNAILRRDYNLVQGSIILFSVFFIIINLIIDLGTIRLDPRLRKAEGGL
ncbi:MAG: ABC transporter permease [Oscillospiraceae bacterium]